MGLIRKLLGKKKGLAVRTEQVKANIYECLKEGKLPEQVLEDNRLTGWKLLNSKSYALSYVKYINGRLQRNGKQYVTGVHP